MTVHKTITALCLAALLSATLAATASAGPAGDEYLPQVPQAGANAGAKPTTSAQQSKSSDKQSAIVPVSNSGGGSGGDSGSILLNPIVLLMIVILIAAALGVTLWRRNTDETEDGDGGASAEPDTAQKRGGPRTPDGEIIGPDQTG